MDITKELLIKRIEPFMDRFTKYFKLGYIKFNSEGEMKEVAYLMKQINPKFNLNFKMNCNSCVRDAITILSNYYSREAKYVTTTEDTPTEPIEAIVETLSTDEGVSTTETNEGLTEPIKDASYYEGLDKRTSEYKKWKASQTEI